MVCLLALCRRLVYVRAAGPLTVTVLSIAISNIFHLYSAPHNIRTVGTVPAVWPLLQTQINIYVWNALTASSEVKHSMRLSQPALVKLSQYMGVSQGNWWEPPWHVHASTLALGASMYISVHGARRSTG